MTRIPTHSVYVVELAPDVWKVRKFAEANAGARPDKSCLYVGRTGLSPEERFRRHKAGIQAARFVKQFGTRLRPKLYSRFNPMFYQEAAEMERELARRLRKRGYPVWQQ